MHMLKAIKRPFVIDNIRSPLNRRFPADYEFSGESHIYWEIVSVTDGKIEVTEDEKVYWLSEGDMIFHGSMEFHRIKSSENTSPKVLNLSFTYEGQLPDALSDGVFKLDVMEQKEFVRIHKAAEAYVRSEEADIYLGQEVADSLSAFILRLCRSNKSKQQLSMSRSALAYKNLVETMNNEVCSNLSIGELAEKNYMSVSYVKELFARYAGVSPKSYYINLRLAEAVRLISEGMSGKEISEKMNFSSPNYFSVFFKKYMNMTPMQFKNENK